MKEIVLRFGLLAAALLLLLKLSQYSLVTRRFSEELMLVVFAMLFISFGFLVSRWVKNKPVSKNKQDISSTTIDEKKRKQLGISKREYEVLDLIAKGHSNLEIANLLFISESTVKTHVSNLLMKLDAKRRTQAVLNAKDHGILL